MFLSELNERVRSLSPTLASATSHNEYREKQRTLMLAKKKKKKFQDEMDKAKEKYKKEEKEKPKPSAPRKENPSIMKALLQSKGAK